MKPSQQSSSADSAAAEMASLPWTGSVRTLPLANWEKLRGVIVGLLFGTGDRQRAQRDAVFAFSVRVMSAAILYAAQILLARWMGVFEYGIYVFVWTWVLILGGMSPFGLGLSVIRFLPQYNERRQHARLRGLLLGSRLFAIATGSAIAGLGAAGLYFFADVATNPYVLPFYIALICIPLFALTDVQDGIGRSQSWMGVALLPPYVLRPLLLLIALAVAHEAGLAMTAVTATAAAIFAIWATAIIQLLWIKVRLPETHKIGRRAYAFRFWLKASMPLAVITACDLALQNVDVLIISKFMSPTDVGIYFAAAKTMSLIMFVHYAVGSATANRFSALQARKDGEGLRRLCKDAVNWTFWPSLAGAVVILALGKPLLWLFGPQFEAGYPVMMILVVGFMLRSSFGPVEFLLNMLGEQKLCAAVLVLSAVVSLILNIVLVPEFGLVGAAIATSLALVLAPLIQAIVAKRRLGLDVAIWKNLPWHDATPRT